MPQIAGSRKRLAGFSRQSLLGIVLLGLLLFGKPASGMAQKFPSKPIEVVIHTSAGGGTDTTARMMAAGLQKELGGTVSVIQKTGGGGLVAINYVGTRPRDGHTVLAITPTHLFAMARGMSSVKIDDVLGVARAADDPLIVVVNAQSPLRTIEDLIARGKRTPIKWGTTQIGGIDHIAAAMLGKRAGTQIAVVPFDSGGEIVTNLLGQNIESAGLNLTEGLVHIKRGTFRALAVMSKERLESLPEVPTTVEKGIPVLFSTVRGYVVLKGTPPGILKTLEAGMLQGMKEPAYQNFLSQSGLGPDSVAGSEVWDAQIRQLYSDANDAMKELGMIQ